jgi:hypothetical protein
MQGQSRMDRELLDAGEIAGHLVPPGSVFAFLAEHRRELFPDSFTADLFGSRTGRPSLPADLVGSVLVLKELHDLSDAQTAEALKFDRPVAPGQAKSRMRTGRRARGRPRRGWRSTATRPRAAGRPAPPTATPAMTP